MIYVVYDFFCAEESFYQKRLFKMRNDNNIGMLYASMLRTTLIYQH